MKSPFKEILIAFLIGALVGWFAATRSFETPMLGKRGHLIEKFSRQLKLTSAQKEQVRVIFDAKRVQFKALREELRPKFEVIRLSSRSEIEKILTPDQIPAFRKMEADWQAQRQKRAGNFNGFRKKG